MLSLIPDRNAHDPLRILCLGAHSDDIEIGCAGTLMRLRSARELRVRWVVFSGEGDRKCEARDSAVRLMGAAALLEVDVMKYEDGFFPERWADIKREFGRLKDERPDLVFTHFGEDRHQDHRVISELTWNTFRNHLILEYEIPKWDGDLGRPNVFMPLSRELAREKASHLVETFPSQRKKPWFTEDTFLALSRIRGIECVASEGHAEGFHVRKAVLQP